MMRKLYLLVIIAFMGCNRPKEDVIHIALTDGDSTVKIDGMDPLILNDIARDTANRFDAVAQVYHMPADTDMRDYQPAQPGNYTVKNGELLFTPDTAFIKGQTYFLRYYRHRTSNTIWDFLSGSKTARGLKHNDLIFKP